MKTIVLSLFLIANYAVCNSQIAKKPLSRIVSWYHRTCFELSDYQPPHRYDSVTTWIGDYLWDNWRTSFPWGWDSLRTNYYNSKKPDFRYGRVDVCMRIDSMHKNTTGVMTHSAAWLLNLQNEIVQEIDIVEYTGNRLLFSAHWNYVTGNYDIPGTGILDPNYRRYIEAYVPEFDVSEYVVYSIEWAPRKIKWYINSEPISVLYMKMDRPMFFVFSNIRQETVLWVNVWTN